MIAPDKIPGRNDQREAGSDLAALTGIGLAPGNGTPVISTTKANWLTLMHAFRIDARRNGTLIIVIAVGGKITTTGNRTPLPAYAAQAPFTKGAGITVVTSALNRHKVAQAGLTGVEGAVALIVTLRAAISADAVFVANRPDHAQIA